VYELGSTELSSDLSHFLLQVAVLFGIGVSCSLFMQSGVYSGLGKQIDAGDRCSCMCALAHLVGVITLMDSFSRLVHCIALRRRMCRIYRR
jgi:hypothetical protein